MNSFHERISVFVMLIVRPQPSHETLATAYITYVLHHAPVPELLYNETVMDRDVTVMRLPGCQLVNSSKEDSWVSGSSLYFWP